MAGTSLKLWALSKPPPQQKNYKLKTSLKLICVDIIASAQSGSSLQAPNRAESEPIRNDAYQPLPTTSAVLAEAREGEPKRARKVSAADRETKPARVRTSARRRLAFDDTQVGEPQMASVETGTAQQGGSHQDSEIAQPIDLRTSTW